MTSLEKLQQKREATIDRIERLKLDEKRVAAKRAAAEIFLESLATQIAAATSSETTAPTTASSE